MDYEPLSAGEQEGMQHFAGAAQLCYIDEGTMGASSSSAEHEQEDGPPVLSQIEVEKVATNVKNMINQYFTVSTLHLRCPIRMLQFAIKDAINDHDSVNRLIVKVGNVVRNVRKTTLHTEQTDCLGVPPTTACITSRGEVAIGTTRRFNGRPAGRPMSSREPACRLKKFMSGPFS